MKIDKTLLDAIQRQLKKAHSVVVGINGLDCSGKTTLSLQLKSCLKDLSLECKLLHVDDYNNNAFQADFYQQYISTGLASVDLEQYYSKSIHYDELKPAILKQVGRCKVVVVEGVFLFKPGLSDVFTIKVFLETQYNVAIDRYRMRRDLVNDERPLEVMKNIWIPAYERYLSECNPKAQSDLVFIN